MDAQPRIVSSWNEWDPLEEIVVGVADNACYEPTEPRQPAAGKERAARNAVPHFPLDFYPSHIDCTFVPLRPGLVLTNPERPLRESEEEMFLANGWDLVAAPQPTTGNDEMPDYCQSSKWLSMNVLSVSPGKVICEEREKPLHDLLRRRDFEVYTFPFRNVFEYGGSLHCATWDIRRAGTMEDYFPALGSHQPAW